MPSAQKQNKKDDKSHKLNVVNGDGEIPKILIDEKDPSKFS